MSILIFGASGMLGHKLYQTLAVNHSVFGTIRGPFSEVERFRIFRAERIIEHVDVADIASIRSSVERSDPDVVINAVGLIKQLPAAKNIENALTTNAILPHRLAELATEFGFKLISVSTDCVFDGKRGNYSEADEPDARDLYGISKSLGEVAEGNSLTLRTSIIGRELGSRNSIVEWFLAQRGGKVSGYRRALYSGLTTIEFARVISMIIDSHAELQGVYNVSADFIAKLDLLHLLNRAFDAGISIAASDEVVIDRTLDSTAFRLATGYVSPSWESMIMELAADATPYDSFRS